MRMLGTGLGHVDLHEDALSVREAELSVLRRVGAPEVDLLTTLGNIACSYEKLGRNAEEALRMRRKIYSGFLNIFGESHEDTLREGGNYIVSLLHLKRFDKAKTLLCRMMPVARRALGSSHRTTLRMSWHFAMALYENDRATLDDLREAVTMLEETERTARRVFGGAHPFPRAIQGYLRNTRAALTARETPSGST